MSFSDCRVYIVVNKKLNIFQKIKWWFKELLIQTAIKNKAACGMTIEDVLVSSNLLESDDEYLVHLSTLPEKYEVKNKKLDGNNIRKRRHYIPRLTIYVTYKLG